MTDTTPAADFLTLFSPADGALATKRVTLAGVESAPHVSLHRVGEAPVRDFGELAHALTRLVSEPSWYVVRGKLRPGVDVGAARRAHLTDPTLDAAPHRWLLLDLDHVRDDVDATAFAADPAAYAPIVRDLLPAAFQDARMWWMATGGAGFKPGVRMRAAFWLSRPLADGELKSWCGTWACEVDQSLFTPSQPHYTASPLFEGVADPVPAGARCGVLEGSSDTVQVPHEWLGGKAGVARDALDKAARSLARMPEGERRNKLNKRAFALARQFGAVDLPADEIASALFGAAHTAGLPDSETLFTLRNAIRDGRAKHEAEHAGWRELLARDKEDAVRSTQANTTLFLEHHEAFKGRMAINARTHSAVWIRSPDWSHRERGALVGSDDIARIVEWFQRFSGIDAREAWVRAGVHKAASDHEFDAFQDWLEAIPAWDATARLSSVFVRHLGAEDNELNRAFSVLWHVQVVRRAYATLHAPVKADYMIMLMGPQGIGKTSYFSRMAPPGSFRSGLPDVTGKDAMQAMGDSLIVELAEFTQRKADADAFKAFVTRDVDKYRPPYGRDEIATPRRCVIAITTNEEQPLTDPTGNRRFWPIAVRKRADLEAVSAERDQVWAEALHYARAGVPATLPTELELLASERQEEHREENAYSEAFRALAARDSVPYASGFEYEPGQADGGRVRYLRIAHACAMVGMRADNRSAASVKVALADAGWSERRADGRRAWFPPARDSERAAAAAGVN